MTNPWIRKESLHGALWLSAAGAVISGANLVIFAVVARYISPLDFGVVAFATICVELLRLAFLSVVTDAIIRRPDVAECGSSTAFWCAIIAAFLGVLACVAVAAPLMELYFAEGAGWIFAIMSISLLFEAPRCVHEGLLKRAFQYRAIAWRMAAAILAGGLIAVPLAVGGAGAWALVVQRLASAALQLFVSWRVLAWRPSWRFSIQEARKLLEFCFHAGGGRLIGQIGEKLPEAIIGGIAGLEALAFYRVGARGLDSVSQLVVQPAAGVALSALARVDPSEREQQFSRLVRILALVAVPTYLGAGGVAPEFVELLFGAQWSSSAIVMTLLAFTAPSCLLLPLISQQLLAVGMSRQLMLASVINTGLVCAPVLGASFVTLTTSVSAQAFGANVALIAVLSLFCKSMSFSFGGIIKCLAPALSAGALMMLAILVLRPLIEHFPLLERLAMLLCVGACAYVLSLLVLFREYSRLAWTELAPVLPWHIARMKPGSLM